MQLEFVKKGNNYEAIFEVPSDFNIHIELNKPSYLGVYQSSVQDGEYSFATEYKLNDIQKVYDIDFGALVYPKYIKVVSGSEVVSASVNFNEGGGSGSGSGSGEDSKIYFKFPDDVSREMAQNIIAQFAILFGCVKNGKYIVAGSGSIIEALSVTYKSFCADGSLEILHNGEVISLDKYVQSKGMPSLKDAFISTGCTEITKEQFYNLEA